MKLDQVAILIKIVIVFFISNSFYTFFRQNYKSVVKNKNALDQDFVNDNEHCYDYLIDLKLVSILVDATIIYYLFFLDLIIIFIATFVITIEFDALIDIN